MEKSEGREEGEIAPVLRNMDAEMLKQRSKERDRTDQKNRELEGSLGIALQTIKRLEARVQAEEMDKAREGRRKIVQDEGKKVDFFPQWKPQQGVVEEPEEEEEYLSLGEDGRPYITSH